MVRFGIVGFGLHVEKRLMPAFRQSRNAQVVALTRRDLAKAAAAAEKYAIPHAFTNAEELCRCPDVDAVYVATPCVCHCADTVLALRHGKPVLCEKPMAMSADESRRMIDAAISAGRLLGVAQVMRFARSVQRMRERVSAGEIGRVIFARSDFSYQGIGHARTWIHDRSVGGGSIFEVGVHCIDTLRFILQDEVAQVDARSVFDRDSRDADAASALLLQFTQGTLANVQVTLRAEYRTPLEFVGTAGVLRAEDGLSVDRPTVIELVSNRAVVEREELSNSDAFVRQLEAFATAVESGGEFACTGEDALRTQLVIDAAHSSGG